MPSRPPQDLLDAATAALKHAYCPYSQFPVAAAIRSSNQNIYTGCNIENAAYSLCCCAETNTIGSMINSGDTTISQILVLIPGPKPASPCGGCRQQLSEFSTKATKIYLCCTQGQHEHYSFFDLLPHSFNAQLLEK